MKRNLFFLLILCGIILTGCVYTANVGVIGGADGPTSIYVKNETGETVKKPLRMIRVDGKLYYDSGKVSEMVPRCGTMDGNLVQTGAEFEIPKNDNTCNFSGAEGYQNATSITKEISIDGEWVIFKLFDDPELDMDVFKYCFYLKGKSPNAENAHEIVVLTEDINYDFEAHNQLFSSQLNPADKKYRTTFRVYGDTDTWGVTLAAKDVTNTGLTVLFEQFGGAPTGKLQTGAAFSLERLCDYAWEPVEIISSQEPVWHSIAYGIKENEITELKTEWEYIYGALSPGQYKLKKEIMDFREAGDYDVKEYSLYFTIA